MRGIHRSPVNSSHKAQWRGALAFSLICAWINGWVNNCETSRPLWRHCNGITPTCCARDKRKVMHTVILHIWHTVGYGNLPRILIWITILELSNPSIRFRSASISLNAFPCVMKLVLFFKRSIFWKLSENYRPKRVLIVISDNIWIPFEWLNYWVF